MTSEQFIHSLVGRNLGWEESMHATYMMARDVISRGILGDFVECGVYSGAECAVMARAIIDMRPLSNWRALPTMPRRVHLFDSFEGIPQPGPEDSEFMTSGNPKGSACCSLEQVKANMREWGIPDELLVYHEGWFEQIMPLYQAGNAVLGSISLLRIDCDLYKSTKTCMKYMYPLVSRGGWVIVDDYELSGCRKAVSEVVIPMPCYFEKFS